MQQWRYFPGFQLQPHSHTISSKRGNGNLFRAIKDQPGSITAISERIHHDRSAVKRDVDALARIGLVQIEVKVLPGHGRMKEVSATAECVLLQAEVA
ncbi:MAG: hypothetical protein HYU78_08900 [Rhodocyclales bacterium]|nr:hypothetical protein [Rhodocyclales bacterium]